MPLGVLRSPRRLGTGGPWELGPLGATAWDPWNSWARSHQEPQADPRRLQEAPGGPRRFQEATGGLRRPQEATADPRRSQEATGGPRRPLEVPGAGETHEVPGVVSLGPITQEEPGASRFLFWRSSGESKFLAPPGSSWSFGASWLLLASPGSSFGAPLFRHFLIKSADALAACV